jgi:hypothetical protein
MLSTNFGLVAAGFRSTSASYRGWHGPQGHPDQPRQKTEPHDDQRKHSCSAYLDATQATALGTCTRSPSPRWRSPSPTLPFQPTSERRVNQSPGWRDDCPQRASKVSIFVLEAYLPWQGWCGGHAAHNQATSVPLMSCSVRDGATAFITTSAPPRIFAFKQRAAVVAAAPASTNLAVHVPLSQALPCLLRSTHAE